MQPPRRRPRQEGNPRPLWGLRPTSEVETYVLRQLAALKKAERSALLHELIEHAMFAQLELGDDWYEILKQASLEKVEPGTMLGRLARSALHRKK